MPKLANHPSLPAVGGHCPMLQCPATALHQVCLHTDGNTLCAWRAELLTN